MKEDIELDVLSLELGDDDLEEMDDKDRLLKEVLGILFLPLFLTTCWIFIAVVDVTFIRVDWGNAITRLLSICTF